MESTRETRDAAKPKNGPIPTQAEASQLKAHAILGRDARAADDELPPPVEHDPPTPTQDQSDALLLQAHGHDPDSAPPVNVDVPHVSGGGTVGSTLNCTMGNWDGEPTSYSYRWLNEDAAPVGNGPDYVAQAGDEGHSLACTVTATNAYGSTAAPPSNAVAVTAETRRAASAGPAPATRKTSE
jgi:hypothetical protein